MCIGVLKYSSFLCAQSLLSRSNRFLEEWRQLAIVHDHILGPRSNSKGVPLSGAFDPLIPLLGPVNPLVTLFVSVRPKYGRSVETNGLEQGNDAE